MNKETFLITDETIETAKTVCGCIDDENIRNRAVANVFAAKLAGEFFQDYEADTESGLHNIPTVLKEIDIADIYVQNSYIDARVYFEDNDLCVPKSHFDNNNLPVAYMFIKVDKELSSRSVTGFITPGDVNRVDDIEGYYPVDEDQLISFYDIEPLLNASYSDDLTTELKKAIYDYADSKLSGNKIFRELIESKEGRLLLQKACLAQKAYNELKNNETVTDIISPLTAATDAEHENITEELSELDISDNSNEDTLLEQDEMAVFEDLSSDNELAEIESDTLEELTLDNDSNSFDGNQNNIQIDGDVDFIEENISEDAVDLADEPMDLLNEVDNLSSEQFAEPDDNILNTSDEITNSFSEDILEPNEADEIEAFNITENNHSDYTTETITEEPVQEEDILNELSVDDFENIQEKVQEERQEGVQENVQEEGSEQSGYEPIIAVNEVNEPIQENEQIIEEYSTETTPSLDSIEQDVPDKIDEVKNSENIEELFPEEDVNDEYEGTIDSNQQKSVKKKPSIITILGTVVLLGAGIYYGYNKFSGNNLPDNIPAIPENTAQQPVDNTDKSQPSAMPDESLENVTGDKSKNEGNSISIPSIENHLDSSVLVSNLAVTWEVPAGYINNVSAKRYFTKLGKIMQLNLKTELLLINRPPINNKITLELKFNPDKQYFEIKELTSSSGEKIIDDVVKNIVSKTLEMNLNINLSTFGNIQGNPILIINL